LYDIPVFDDLAVFQAEEVRQSTPRGARLEDEVGVRHDHVALGQDALNLQRQPRVLAAQPVDESLERLRPVGSVRIVLDIYRSPKWSAMAFSGFPAKAVW
jgi:hypothetical protein